MIYVLAIGWEWFAGAFAIGWIVGWLTTTRAPEAVFSGRWVIWAFILALGALAAASSFGMASGRDGLLLDIAFLAGLAYFLGLPAGGAMKSLAPIPAASAPAVKQPPPVVLRGAPAPGPEQEAPAASAPALALDSGEPDAAPVAAKKTFPGARPAGLAAPRNGAPDDLTKVKGIGPKSIDKLHMFGVFHFDQIAAWNLDNARWIGAAISAPGRVERGKWIQQARDLVAATKAGEQE